MEKQWLIIDADDTLWHNNIHFERAFDTFVELLDHSTLGAGQVREIFDGIERENIKVAGYGAKNFGRNMQQCYRLLADRPAAADRLDAVMAIADEIPGQPVELLDGVEDTLAYLAGRHHLTLFSKGNFEEQNGKIDRSGLRGRFDRCRIVKEKDTAGYQRLAAEAGIDERLAWMIGNSPKSDIHPALAAGLGAILIPHENIWSLEMAELPEPSERFRVVERFSDLAEIF